MKWDCDNKIDDLVKQAKNRLNNHIEMLYIHALSKITPERKRVSLKFTSNDDIKKTKSLFEDKIIIYLKKSGYTMNYMLGKTIYTKGFTCVYIGIDYVEVWHDKTNNDKSCFVNSSLLTGLPITLKYFENI